VDQFPQGVEVQADEPMDEDLIRVDEVADREPDQVEEIEQFEFLDPEEFEFLGAEDFAETDADSGADGAINDLPPVGKPSNSRAPSSDAEPANGDSDDEVDEEGSLLGLLSNEPRVGNRRGRPPR
jgi:hypothetical protein